MGGKRRGRPTIPAPPLTVREATRWITSRPDHLTPYEQDKVAQLKDRSPDLAAPAGHLATFAQIMAERTGRENLKGWIATVEADNIPQLRSFTRGIERDLDAVTNGLSLPYSSGAVEGNICRV